ncbi:MAG: hypothetical protein J5797_06115 [Prevotella sp.]|nr:hypothetical protein [Prevotella sp.]
MIKLNFYKNKIQGHKNFGKVYARAKNNKPIEIEGLAKHIAQHGSPYTKDIILGVLSKIAGCVRELVLDGNPVKIADLCIFTPAVTTCPATDAEHFTLTRATRAANGTYSGGNIVTVRMMCRTTGEASREHMTQDAELGYTALAEKIKAGELTLSNTKGEYISGLGSGTGSSSGWGDEPVVNP